MCHINPRVDFAFKKLFGSEENKDLLVSLINSIVDEKDQITSLSLRNPYNLADYQAGKLSVLDIKAVAQNGKWFNIEMQISQDLQYDRRALYYWAKLLTEQLGEGMAYRQLHKTISINILNFELNHQHEEFHNRYRILNAATGSEDAMHDVFELHYIELPKFRKDVGEVSSVLERWSLFLTRAHEIRKENIPSSLSCDPIIVSAIQKVDRMFDEDERKIYEVRMQDLCDVASKIDSARSEGLAEGLKEGMEAGLKEGLKEGIEAGRNSMIMKAHQAGMTTDAIASMFDLPLEQITSLIAKHQ